MNVTINGILVNESLQTAVLRKLPTPKHDIHFAKTQFYKVWKKVYGDFQKVNIPEDWTNKLQTSRIYPIKLTKNSPVYFFMVHSLQTLRQNNYVKCRVYLQSKDLPESPVKRAHSPAQLLLCDSCIIMPSKLLVFYILFNQCQAWDKPFTCDDTADIKDFPLKISPVDHYSLILTYSKCVKMKLPFRRLPMNLSVPILNYLSLSNLAETMENDEFVSTDYKYLGFCDDCFSWQHSLVNLVIDLKNNCKSIETLPELQILMKSLQNTQKCVVKIKCRPIKKKSSRRQGKKQKSLKKAPIIPAKASNTFSVSQIQCEEPKIQDHNSENPSQIFSMSKVHNNNAILTTKNERVTLPRRCKMVEGNKTKENVISRKRNSGSLETTSAKVPRLSSIKTKKNGKHIYKCPQTNIENHGPDFKLKDRSKGISLIVQKLLRRYTSVDVFYEDFFKFHINMKIRFPRIPRMGLREVNLFELFMSTIQRGGFHKVTRNLLWKEVYTSINDQKIVSNAASMAKKHYARLLYRFEEYLFSNTEIHFSLPDSGEKSNIQPLMNIPEETTVMAYTSEQICLPSVIPTRFSNEKINKKEDSLDYQYDKMTVIPISTY